MSYPDILLIPNLAKILDISISELFDSNDIQPEAKETYDNSNTATGDRNKGRLCIGDMEVFIERIINKPK